LVWPTNVFKRKNWYRSVRIAQTPTRPERSNEFKQQTVEIRFADQFRISRLRPEERKRSSIWPVEEKRFRKFSPKNGSTEFKFFKPVQKKRVELYADLTTS